MGAHGTFQNSGIGARSRWPWLRRAARIVAVSALCLVAISCQRFVEIEGLAEVTEFDLPDFRKTGYATYATAAPSGSYLLRPSDLIELEWVGASGPIAVMSSECTGSNCTPCGDLGISPGEPLIEGLSPRLPVSVLGSLSSIEVRNRDSSRTVDFCTSGKSPFASPLTWDRFVRLFRDRGIRPRLLSEPIRRALPGDLVRITILSKTERTPDAAGPFVATQAESRVDERGELFVPALSTSARLDAVQTPNPIRRRAVAGLDNGNLRVAVWQPATDFGRQPSLQAVAGCLSAAWNSDLSASPSPPTRELKAEAGRCLKAGIEGPFFRPGAPATPDEDVQSIRYRLDVDQSWTFVAEDGSHREQRYIPGETIGAAIARTYREFVGRELVSARQIGRDVAYVAIIPRAALGPGRSSRPFSGTIRAGSASSIADVLLAPGDVVHVTRSAPTMR